MAPLALIGFDADDTLWHNERFFRMTQERFAAILAGDASPDHLAERLLEAERRNLRRYGYGIKGFTLSMIETALDVTGDAVSGTKIRRILDAARDMHDHPVEPLPHVHDTLSRLSSRFRLVLITKGDLFDQERKLAASGMGDFFHAVEIVSEKTANTYQEVFSRHGSGPEQAMMVGNSLKSDVLPALKAGSWGVHVPHELTWELEHAPAPVDAPRFREIEHLGDLPGLIEAIAGQAQQ
ncbi:HAD family hydrolase [Zhengella mangrovi]|uniref:HAD family hydrolase n=1 Tax=Zhengella mangrovi TaxID=1982044 RepID=A0A2G1QLT5_9HYPH|nr:HAD family hydrolase [Zhengella mangrovi]PHP66434.1 HAD family hydrolase [Zhengella mangrovi]